MLAYAMSVLEVITINIILSGDNAIVLALVVHNLPARQRRQALIVGGASAVLLQLVFTLTLSYLLRLPGLRFVGALLLASVACRLLQEEGHEVTPAEPSGRFREAVVRIALVNLAMSLDNAIAVASVSRSDPVRIGLGLLVSALIIFACSSLVLQVIGRFRWLAYAGTCVLALTAAGMMWHELKPVLSMPHVAVATLGVDFVASRGARWMFQTFIVATCLLSPWWWPRLSVHED